MLCRVADDAEWECQIQKSNLGTLGVMMQGNKEIKNIDRFFAEIRVISQFYRKINPKFNLLKKNQILTFEYFVNL